MARSIQWDVSGSPRVGPPEGLFEMGQTRQAEARSFSLTGTALLEVAQPPCVYRAIHMKFETTYILWWSERREKLGVWRIARPGNSYLQEKKKFLCGSHTAVSALLHKKKTSMLEKSAWHCCRQSLRYVLIVSFNVFISSNKRENVGMTMYYFTELTIITAEWLDSESPYLGNTSTTIYRLRQLKFYCNFTTLNSSRTGEH